MTKCQCSYCLHMMQVPPTMGGRKILCPLCGDPMTIPKPSEEPEFKKFVLRDSIDKFQYTEWDRAFAHAVLEQKKVPEKKLYAAIGAFMKASRKSSDLSLSQYLETENLLTKENTASLRGLLKGTVKTMETQYVQCPNCFARSDAGKRACKFCGQRLTDPAFVTCPACKCEHKKGIHTCTKCGANLKTGLKELVRRCPACKELVYGDPKQCPACRVTLKTSRQITKEKRLVYERTRKKMIMTGVCAAAILLIILVAWRPLKTGFRMMSVGYAQVSLENRLGTFGKLLKKDAPDVLNPYLTGEIKDMAPRDYLRILCTGANKGSEVKSILSVTLVEIAMSEDEDSAVVTAAVKITLKNEDSATILGRPKTHTVEWYWVRKNDRWLLSVAPVLP